MNLLIIGGTGVLSSAVTAEAIKKGISVSMVNRGRRSVPDNVELIKADKDDYNAIESKIKGRNFDAVIDFLCLTLEQTRRSVNFYQKYSKQYIFISSCAVYDTLTLNGQLGDEESPKGLDMCDYSIRKNESEEEVKNVLKNTDVKYTIIRPCVTYDDTRIPYGISPQYGCHWTLCARILYGKPIIRWNGGINRCNMMRVEDFAVGVVGTIGEKGAYNEAFNICGDECPSWNDVISEMSRILGKEVKTVDITSDFYASHFPSKSGEILGGRSIDSINSNRKIKKLVKDFKQTIPLSKGIEKTIESYKSNNYQKGIDWYFDAKTDRIIKLHLKYTNSNQKDLNLKFIDYLGNAKLSDKATYWCVRYFEEGALTKYLPRVVKKLCSLF